MLLDGGTQVDNGAQGVPVSPYDVLITSELLHRRARAPSHEAENRAMHQLIDQVVNQPEIVPHSIAELCMNLCGAGSAGISVLEQAPDGRVFRWHAIAGGLASNVFGTFPESASPCGEVLARGEVLLFDRPDRLYPGLRNLRHRVYEALLAPWYISGEPAGTLWVVAHTPERKFDSEDARLVQSLARFAAIAHQMAIAVQQVQNIQPDLERRVEERTRALSEAFQILRQESADREQAEIQRAIAEQALRESEKLAAVGRLASSIAHEINNPLEAVTNLLYLASGTATDPQTRQYLEQAQSELSRVTHIATETLRFHRQSTNPGLADLAEIADSVTSLHEARLRHIGIKIERRFKPHHPLLCFPSEIRQVIANLVNNAVDAMKSTPGARLVLCIREAHHCKTNHPGVRITVADTGTGMDKHTQKRAFEAFFTTKEATGIGLGLWVCREIVQKHSGELHVQSCCAKAHHGSVFSIFLPYPNLSGENRKPPQSDRSAQPPGITPSEAHSSGPPQQPSAMAGSRPAMP